MPTANRTHTASMGLTQQTLQKYSLNKRMCLYLRLLCAPQDLLSLLLQTQLDYISQPPLQLWWPCDWVLANGKCRCDLCHFQT